MLKQGCFRVFILLILVALSSCSGVWTGATMVYDRHDVYKKLEDYHLYLKVNDVLAEKKTFKNSQCTVDISVFNGDILIAGHVPTAEYQDELAKRLQQVQGYRRLFNVVRVLNTSSYAVQDSWITAKIRSQIFADSSIDPNAFKVQTTDGVVYLMGDVRTDQAAKVITIARHTDGVVHVVKILKYLVYEK